MTGLKHSNTFKISASILIYSYFFLLAFLKIKLAMSQTAVGAKNPVLA